MPARKGSEGDFRIEGQVRLEELERPPAEMELTAYVFDRAGQLLGRSEVDPKGNFSVPVKLEQPTAVELVIGPGGDPQTVRRGAVYSRSFSEKDWVAEGRIFRIRPELIAIPRPIWWPWWPVQVCVTGHVRKIHTTDGVTQICPVPFVKVEIFDVDREGCWWPFIRRWWDLLLDRPVIRIPDLIAERPFPPKPLPGPDPAPDFNLSPLVRLEKPAMGVSLNPQPLPPGPLTRAEATVGLNPQPEPPGAALSPGAIQGFDPQPDPPAVSEAAFLRVGEARGLKSSLASRLDHLTLTSLVAPWVLFPRCFYSKELVCETTTDCNGYFKCCFQWWPFHFRQGRLRFDLRPDIIIRVTQVINGVTTVIYMDPYTSTRWDINNNAHIDLYLDNDEVVCGSNDCQPRPTGSPVFFTRVGLDEVYKINQGNGLFSEAPLSNVAYGGNLLIFAQFGDALSTGAPPRYYRLSYAKQGSLSFTPLTAELTDTRVNKGTLFSESHNLGPLTVNGVPALYEVRDFTNYYWYNPDWIGSWYTPPIEPDTGAYILRLEVFDQNGVKLTSAMGVDYRDGTVAPPAVLPPMLDRCDLVITLDNKRPDLTLTTPAVNACGVIPWSPSLTLNFGVVVSQQNNRLRSWGFQYTKGVNPAVTVLASGSSNNGLPGTVIQSVSGAPLLVGLTTTCAFALKLWAYPHIRNGYSFIYYTEEIQAIAIEKCS